MNEIWELSTTSTSNMEHNMTGTHKFFLIRAVDGGRTERARNLILSSCRLITKKSQINMDRR
jgi:hypothetical protein